MRIQKFSDYFEEYIDSPVISKITCSYLGGLCSVYFRNGTIRSLVTVATGYNSQFGVPVSLDGKILFVSSWETGLHAYDIDTGEKLWHFKSTRIKAVYVSETHVTAIRYGESILVLDITEGSKLKELRSSTIECSYELHSPYVLVDTYKGKFSVINVDSMSIVKSYPKSVTNPRKAISFMVREASLSGSVLSISGLENQRSFCRVIDSTFLPNNTEDGSLF